MSRIKAGDLRTQVTLMRPTGAWENETTGTSWRRGAAFEDVATVPAARREVSGREFFEAHAVYAEDVVTFTLRWRADVTAKWRVRHHGTVYNILEVNHLGDMYDYMRLKCRDVEAGGE